MSWLKRVTGVQELINEQKKENLLLEKIESNTWRSAKAVEKYNKAYHV